MAHKEEVLDYVMNTPQNTNPAVLGNMLDNYENGGGGGGITVIECEVRGSEGGDYTLINADKLAQAIDDMQAHYEKAFSYGLILTENIEYDSYSYSYTRMGRGDICSHLSDNTPCFGFMDGSGSLAAGDGKYEGERSYDCGSNSAYYFYLSDIDENGVATLSFHD